MTTLQSLLVRKAPPSPRTVAGALGTVAWLAWLASAAHARPSSSFVLWAAAFLLWGIALFSPWTTTRPDRATHLAVTLLVAALIPRSGFLARAPYGVTYDEVIHPYLGLEVLRQRPWEILAGTLDYFREPFFTAVLQAWPCLALPPLLGARVASAVLGIGSLAATYALARRLFGWRPAIIALAALALSACHLVYCRSAYPYVQPMLFVPLTLWAILAATEQENRFLAFLAGALLGLAMLAYTPTRIVLPIIVVWTASRILGGGLPRRQTVRAVLPIGLGAILVLSPILQSAGVSGLFGRYRAVAQLKGSPLQVVADHGWASAEARAVLDRQLRAAVAVYVDHEGTASASIEHGLRGPLLDPWLAPIVALGLVLALLRLRDSGHLLIVVWVAGTFVAGQLLTDLPNAAYRAAPILPALAIAAGLAGDLLVRRLRRWSLGAALLIAILALGVAPDTAAQVADYLRLRSTDNLAAMARLIAVGPRDTVYYIVSPGPVAQDPVVRFLAEGRSASDAPSLTDTLARGIEPDHDLAFVIDPALSSAADVLLRQFPGATLTAEAGIPHSAPALGIGVSRDAVAARARAGELAPAHGLLARYYPGESWDGPPLLERVEEWPYRYRTPDDQYRSAEWSGTIRLPSSGEYRFELLNLDHAEGQLTVGAGLHPTGSGSRWLEAGEYPITIRCRLVDPAAACYLRWQPPGQSPTLVPPSFFEPPAPPTDG